MGDGRKENANKKGDPVRESHKLKIRPRKASAMFWRQMEVWIKTPFKEKLEK